MWIKIVTELQWEGFQIFWVVIAHFFPSTFIPYALMMQHICLCDAHSKLDMDGHVQAQYHHSIHARVDCVVVVPHFNYRVLSAYKPNTNFLNHPFLPTSLTFPSHPSPPLPIPLFNTARLPPDERNLLYVAATRAKRQLIITPTLLHVLHRAGVNITCCCSITILLQVGGGGGGGLTVEGFQFL